MKVSADGRSCIDAGCADGEMVTIVGTGGTLSEPLIVDAREMQFCRVNEKFLDTLLDRARETAQKPDANDIPF